jgi:hypothetical protein
VGKAVLARALHITLLIDLLLPILPLACHTRILRSRSSLYPLPPRDLWRACLSAMKKFFGRASGDKDKDKDKPKPPKAREQTPEATGRAVRGLVLGAGRDP